MLNGKIFFISIGAMVSLYIIGFIANIDFLALKVSRSNTVVAFLPIIVGLLIAFIGDGVIRYKSGKHNQ